MSHYCETCNMWFENKNYLRKHHATHAHRVKAGLYPDLSGIRPSLTQEVILLGRCPYCQSKLYWDCIPYATRPSGETRITCTKNCGYFRVEGESESDSDTDSDSDYENMMGFP